MEFSEVWHDQGPISEQSFPPFMDMSLENDFFFEAQDLTNSRNQDTSQTIPQEDTEVADTTMSCAPDESDSATPEKTSSCNTTGTLFELNEMTTGEHKSSSQSPLEFDPQVLALNQQRSGKENDEWCIQEQPRNIYSQISGIPPTPNSVEMHGTNSHYYALSDGQQSSTFERLRMQMEEPQMVFTPLVSPAVTPHDFQAYTSEYSVPATYFSPLGSPALQAQEDTPSFYEQRPSWLASPYLDMNCSSSMMPEVSGQNSLRLQARKTSGIRHSPMIRPDGRKRSISSPLDCLSDARKEMSEGVSENFSTMAPPPLPSPTTADNNSYINRPIFKTLANGHVIQCPATPASLMRIQTPKASYIRNMNGFILPAGASSDGSQPSPIETEALKPEISSSMNVAEKMTSELQSLPSPAFSYSGATISVNQSPQSEDTGTASRTPRKSRATVRISKKRGNKLSHSSPALLPRISPNILPSLPNGAKTLEDASLFLTSKSNYQNILEGTHFPGVYYSSELSTNLSSKRTSHKIAEQGRRNRMNSALQELAKLLPRAQEKESGCEKSGNAENEDGDGSTSSKGLPQSANSKASTVEQAIVYINFLKTQIDNASRDASKKAEDVEQKIES